MLSSSRRSISYPNPDRTDRPDVPAHLKLLVDALEIDMIYKQGTNAARLAATDIVVGTVWYETNTNNFFYYDGTTWHQFNTAELAYVQRTSSLAIAATDIASATTIVTAAAVVLDGATKIQAEITIPSFSDGADNAFAPVLYDNIDAGGDAAVTLYGSRRFQMADGIFPPVYEKRIWTPAVGSHVFSLRGFTASMGGTVHGGTGLGGNLAPIYLSISKR